MAAPASSVWIGWFGALQVSTDGSGGIIFPGNVQGERFLGAAGTAALPTHSFYASGAGDNGMYLSATDTLGWSAGGTLRLSLSTTFLTSTLPINISTGYLAFGPLDGTGARLSRNGINLDVVTSNDGAFASMRMLSLTVTSGTTLINSSSSFANGAAAQLGTLTNSPTAGNPTKWIPVNDNGTTRYLPAW